MDSFDSEWCAYAKRVNGIVEEKENARAYK